MRGSYVLSKRLVKSKAALLDKTLTQISDAAFKPGTSYLFRVMDNPDAKLATVSKVAHALGVPLCEVMEELPAQ